MTCIAFVLERIRSIARNISEMTAYQTQPPTNHCLIFAKSFIKRLLISGCFYYTTLLRRFFKKTKMFTNLFWKCGFREEKTPICVVHRPRSFCIIVVWALYHIQNARETVYHFINVIICNVFRWVFGNFHS